MFDLKTWADSYLVPAFYNKASIDWNAADDHVLFHIPMPLKDRPHRMSRGILVTLSPAVIAALQAGSAGRNTEIGKRSLQSVTRWLSSLEIKEADATTERFELDSHVLDL